eukprot:COSAG02_NODE_3591_length_6516_cov_4.904161_6_plen_88_part_00
MQPSLGLCHLVCLASRAMNDVVKPTPAACSSLVEAVAEEEVVAGSVASLASGSHSRSEEACSGQYILDTETDVLYTMSMLCCCRASS